MRKLIGVTLGLLAATSLSFGATLNSMDKAQVEQAFVNKTFTSIGTDNLNGHTIDNTFSAYLDNHGKAWGKFAQKPHNQPQADTGVYSIDDDGTFKITWQHWDDAKPICVHLFDTKNAYIAIDCANVFHSAFMKDAIQSGNHL